MKILFVGNSHTFFNDMPELFARFAEETTGQKPEVTMLAYGGRSYEWHYKEYTSLRFNLVYGGYDYCVFQQAAHPYPPEESTLEFGRKIAELCKKNNVTPVVYMTWAEERFPENQQKMIDTCRKLAGISNSILAPIGAVWQRVREDHPDIDLYYRDGEHAGPYGDFLIAAVLCKLLCKDVSENVSGNGFDFMPDSPWVITEDREKIPTALDKDKTDKIIAIVKSWDMSNN